MKQWILSLLFIAPLALIGAGCGDEEKNTSTEENTPEEVEEMLEEEEEDIENDNDNEDENGDVLDPLNEEGDDAEVEDEDAQEVLEEESSDDSLTLEKVAEHTTADDCWLVIDGTVYDVTDFISGHPGGDAMLSGCGTDATELFGNRPGSGTPHSESARGMLPQYEIGALE